MKWLADKLFIWWPLCFLSKVGMDRPYATKVLRWEVNDAWSRKELHFRKRDGTVVRPVDYSKLTL